MGTFKAQLNPRCADGNRLAVDLYTEDEAMGTMMETIVHIDFFDNLISEEVRERIEAGKEVEFRLVEANE